MEDYPIGVVYIVDEDDFILQEFQCEYSYAIQAYMGQRDHLGHRYIIKKFGEPTTPYKRKPKKLLTVHQPES